MVPSCRLLACRGIAVVGSIDNDVSRHLGASHHKGEEGIQTPALG